MKNRLLTLLLGILGITSNAQYSETFTRNFNNDNGLYGKITFTIQTTSSYSLNIKCNNISIEGINTGNGNYTNKDLADYGILFPINNAKGYFVVNGKTTVWVEELTEAGKEISGTGRYVNAVFNGNEFVYSKSSGAISGTYTANYSKQIKDLIREANKNKKQNLWRETGKAWPKNSVHIRSINIDDHYGINDAIRNLERDKQNKEEFDNLISQVYNTQTDQEKLDILTKAKQYANDSQKPQLENQIQNLKNKIAEDKQQQITKQNEQNSKSTDTDYWGDKKSPTKSNSANNTQVTETKGQKAGREYQEWTEEQDKQREQTLNGNNLSAENSYYVNAVSSATLSSLNGDYKAATQQYTQLALNGITSGNNKNAIVGTTGALLSAWQNAANQKRNRQLQYNAFNEQAKKYRSKVKTIIRARKSFVNQPKLKSTVYEDGSSFKPIYIYFAFVDKDYHYSKENIKFPNTMEIKINETAKVQFSQVFAFFPYSNGQYPLISDIKKKILNEHFRNTSNDFEVFFFPWERSVKNIVNSLQQNMNDAVSKHYFANAIPSNKNEIEFIVSNSSASQTKDYWTGEQVKKKETKKTDYWKN